MHQNGKVVNGPWINRPRLPLNTFASLAQERQTQIKEMQNSLLYAQKLFIEEKDIWPDQCDRVIYAINTMNEPVQSFYTLLDTAAQLPMSVGPLRYPLVRTLHNTGNLVNELLLLITLFRGICRLSSKQVITQRREIQRKLGLLVQSTEDILQNVDTLLTQARFQEQILINL